MRGAVMGGTGDGARTAHVRVGSAPHWRAALRWRAVLAVLGLVASLGLTPLAAQPSPAVPPLAFADLTVPAFVGTSPALRTPIPFSMLGLSTQTLGDVQVRTSIDARQWTAWQSVEIDDAGPSDPLWTGAAQWLQLQRPLGGTSAHSTVVHLVDSLSLGATQRQVRVHEPTSEQVNPVTGRPAIITRAQWGADETLRKDRPRYARKVRALIVHHTAGMNSYRRHEAAAVVRGIYGYHTQVRGWDDLGYHFLVDRFGQVFEGRAGGIDRAVIGAHAAGFNVETSGVAVMGNFERATITPEARDALVDVLAWKASLHDIDPRATTTFRSGGSTRYAAGTVVRLHTLSGHRDVSQTACPGRSLYALLPQLREHTARHVRARPQAPTTPTPVPLLPILSPPPAA